MLVIKFKNCAAISLLALFAMGTAGFSACSVDSAAISSNGKVFTFRVELAATPEDRAIGLMFRRQMDVDSGMMFIYPNPSYLVFWMKNTYISLDILFFDKTGLITKVLRNNAPLSQKKLIGGPNLVGALELLAGSSSLLGLGVGDQIQYPLLDQETAVWPC
ncbi:MAG: DUF192 domain-containing protein [Proteobacteria bacterium]|nr:DUF192 domain-containing protein [Pseudomonadota bacterium]